jgi:hypothetical protein
MSRVAIITHFSSPQWPLVNKLGAICKCLDVKSIHCSSLDKLNETLNGPPLGRSLFFTDEGMLGTVQHLDTLESTKGIEVAMFIDSQIPQAAEKISNLSIVKYLIGVAPNDANGRDLSTLIKKFSDGDILDLDKYLAFGCKVHERKINSAKAKKEAIAAVSHYIVELGDPGYNHPFGEYARRVSELAEELILNAVFSANPRLRGTDRSQEFKLNKDEEILMSWGFDGEFFGIAVRDPFGKFDSNTIMKYLSTQKSLEQVITGESGGLGLKFIFEKAHQIVANVRNERVTEVIALMRFVNRMLEFEKQKKSFYFFDNSQSSRKD